MVPPKSVFELPNRKISNFRIFLVSFEPIRTVSGDDFGFLAILLTMIFWPFHLTIFFSNFLWKFHHRPMYWTIHTSFKDVCIVQYINPSRMYVLTLCYANTYILEGWMYCQYIGWWWNQKIREINAVHSNLKL